VSLGFRYFYLLKKKFMDVDHVITRASAQNHARLRCTKEARGFFATELFKQLSCMSCTVQIEHILHEFFQVQMF
jgi:hypothetical protein